MQKLSLVTIRHILGQLPKDYSYSLNANIILTRNQFDLLAFRIFGITSEGLLTNSKNVPIGNFFYTGSSFYPDENLILSVRFLGSNTQLIQIGIFTAHKSEMATLIKIRNSSNASKSLKKIFRLIDDNIDQPVCNAQISLSNQVIEENAVNYNDYVLRDNENGAGDIENFRESYPDVKLYVIQTLIFFNKNHAQSFLNKYEVEIQSDEVNNLSHTYLENRRFYVYKNSDNLFVVNISFDPVVAKDFPIEDIMNPTLFLKDRTYRINYKIFC